MSKFKVGDEVAVAAIMKISSIQPQSNGTVSYCTDRGITIPEHLMEQIALEPKEQKAKEPKPEPKPAHRFKVGDRVVMDGVYGAEISAVSKLNGDSEPYLVYCPRTGFHSGDVGEAVCKPEHANKCNWASEDRLSPAPEPKAEYVPKLYDRVTTRNGAGFIAKIYDVDSYIVIHDKWRGGHNADSNGKELNVTNASAYYYAAYELTPIKE